MKVSIATISLNQCAFISDAVGSVLAQDYADIEYIVVDAGSTDGSRDLINQFRDRIHTVVFETDLGPADGLNKALYLASGEIWACVNADDLLLPHAASAAARAFDADPLLDVVYGDGFVVDGDAHVLKHERSDDFSPRRYAYGIGTVMQQSTFIRRNAVIELGGYNVSNRTCWDGELLLELALRGSPMRHVQDVWGVFRRHANSITGSQRAAIQYKADRNRLFERARGRPWRVHDGAIVAAARAWKAWTTRRGRDTLQSARYAHRCLAMRGVVE
jgi:glycosyltransferase involved in cell wall biosynthesis